MELPEDIKAVVVSLIAKYEERHGDEPEALRHALEALGTRIKTTTADTPQELIEAVFKARCMCLREWCVKEIMEPKAEGNVLMADGASSAQYLRNWQIDPQTELKLRNEMEKLNIEFEAQQRYQNQSGLLEKMYNRSKK